jgi:formylglycine-generating enzyme required for sulfatase activity
MVKIPAGTFMMGSPTSEIDRDQDEKQHQVRIEQDFAIGKYEVTVGQFKKFVEATGYKTEAEKDGGCYYWADGDWKKDAAKNWKKPGFSQDKDQPVVCVSWNDAMAYAKWLTEKTGRQYRLPTEAEWEYAARAGTTTVYYWGDNTDEGCRYANGADQTAKAQFPNMIPMNCQDGFVYTAPVGRFQPNAFGLYDMLGNVWEWTCSEYDENYEGGEKICVEGNPSSQLRVLRGGAWDYDPHYLRAAYRSKFQPDIRQNSIGFRLYASSIKQ